jgi:prepilin-type N-terminal cleavage/methylation domain-containing protein
MHMNRMSPPLSPAPPPKPSAGRGSDRRQSRHSLLVGAGFTLLELLLVLALAGVLILLGMPAMLNAFNRAKLTGFAQQAATAMQGARLEAIKRSLVARVEVHFADNSVLAYVDTDKDGVFTPGTDFLVFQAKAPPGVVLGGPGTTGSGGTSVNFAVYNFDAIAGGGVALFNPDGSVKTLGGFRVRDQRGNIMEAFVSPQASARIALRKYAGDPNGTDDPAKYFEADESPGWTWN